MSFEARLAEMDIPWEIVRPLYRDFLHGNFALMNLDAADRDEFFRIAQKAVRAVSPAEIGAMLDSDDWRPRLVGSWIAGLQRLSALRDKIGNLLLASNTYYAGQGYSIALALLCDLPSAHHLVRYLDLYLPQMTATYDQHWALPALCRIDFELRTNFAERFLMPGGLWERWACRRRLDLTRLRADFDRVLRIAITEIGNSR